MPIAYVNYFRSLEGLVNETMALVRRSGSSSADSDLEQLLVTQEKIKSEAPLRITLVGEFSAGKSSIISALTGAQLAIDADVSTSVSDDFDWRGLVLVDTPGVQAEAGSTGHDRIAKEATVGADLVLFVVTNELFNQRLADYLHFVLDQETLGLSAKTCLIVNKIDRECNAESVLYGEISSVLGPHQSIPIFFCSAAKYLNALREQGPIRARFLRQSRFSELEAGLDAFVSDAGITGRLATPLTAVSRVLDTLQSEFASTEDDRKHLEVIKRQQFVLQRLNRRILDIRKTWKQKAFSTVMAQANNAVEQLSDISHKEDLETLFEVGLREATADLDELQLGLQSDFLEAIENAKEQLEEIGDSPLGREVAQIETERSERVRIEFEENDPGSPLPFHKFAKGASRPFQKSLEEAAKNSKGMRDAVYKAGKAIGKKFRPYEAIKGGEKLAKALGRFGKAVPLLAAALDTYMQYREEKAKEAQQRFLANLRLALRGAFADQARVEAEAIEKAVLKVARGPIQDAVDNLDNQADRICVTGNEREELQRALSHLKRRCSVLRDELYSGPLEKEPR